MFVWSMRFSTALTFGPHGKRWYVAETPNMASDVAMNTALPTFAAGEPARAMRTTPIAIANGNAPRWIHPRQAGRGSGVPAARPAADRPATVLWASSVKGTWGRVPVSCSACMVRP